MGIKTEISWTDSTWSPIRVRVKADAAEIASAKGCTSLVEIAGKMAGRVGQHCEHVSPGCEHCYAETNNHRCLPANGTGLPYDRRSRDLVEAFVDEKALLQPLKWRTVQIPREPGSFTIYEDRLRRIFVENQSDLFGEWVSDEMIDRVFAVMALCPQHIYQLLTKRSARMLAYISDTKPHGMGLGRDVVTRIADINSVAPVEIRHRWPLPNVWLGVSPVDQPTADALIPLLLKTPAAVRYVSCEPLLGPVDMWKVDVPARWSAECGQYAGWDWHDFTGQTPGGIDQIIVGGESGPGARPMHPDWARSLRDQCTAASVPYFFKQWGEMYPCNDGDGFKRIGKKAAGALLDGHEWKQFPEPR